MPHHCRVEEAGRWREGVTLSSSSFPSSSFAATGGTREEESGEGTYVDIGGSEPAIVFESISPGVRVTLDRGSGSSTTSTSPSPSSSINPDPKLSYPQTATAVSPSLPRETHGLYTGYTVRRAPSLSAIFTSPPEDYLPTGYDYCIGTSERGDPLPSFLSAYHASTSSSSSSSSSPLSPNPIENKNDNTAPKRRFQHLLIAFGGVAGLEAAVANDEALKKRGIGPKRAREVFDAWVDLVPGQGSRTVRTEEAVWLGCAGLRGLWA